MAESGEKWTDFRTEDSWQGTLDPCKTGNTHKNQPEVYFCVLDGEANPLRVWGRLSLAFPTEQLEEGHSETEEGLTGNSGSWATVSVSPVSQRFQIFYDMALLSVGPWVSHFTPQFFHLKQTGLILLTLQNRYEDLKYHMLTAKHGHLLLLIVVSLCPFKQSFLKELLLTELLLTQTTSLPTALFHSHLRVSSV